MRRLRILMFLTPFLVALGFEIQSERRVDVLAIRYRVIPPLFGEWHRYYYKFDVPDFIITTYNVSFRDQAESFIRSMSRSKKPPRYTL